MTPLTGKPLVHHHVFGSIIFSTYLDRGMNVK